MTRLLTPPSSTPTWSALPLPSPFYNPFFTTEVRRTHKDRHSAFPKKNPKKTPTIQSPPISSPSKLIQWIPISSSIPINLNQIPYLLPFRFQLSVFPLQACDTLRKSQSYHLSNSLRPVGKKQRGGGGGERALSPSSQYAAQDFKAFLLECKCKTSALSRDYRINPTQFTCSHHR